MYLLITNHDFGDEGGIAPRLSALELLEHSELLALRIFHSMTAPQQRTLSSFQDEDNRRGNDGSDNYVPIIINWLYLFVQTIILSIQL